MTSLQIKWTWPLFFFFSFFVNGVRRKPDKKKIIWLSLKRFSSFIRISFLTLQQFLYTLIITFHFIIFFQPNRLFLFQILCNQNAFFQYKINANKIHFALYKNGIFYSNVIMTLACNWEYLLLIRNIIYCHKVFLDRADILYKTFMTMIFTFFSNIYRNSWFTDAHKFCNISIVCGYKCRFQI